MKTLYTIGHSTHSSEELIAMLRAFSIGVVADIRSFPGSRRYPQFNSTTLRKTLEENGIQYRHFEDLGGRRSPLPDSQNTAWRVAAFRGYADYMETPAFKKAADELAELATDKRTSIMCSEAVWWRCHRSLVADYFKSLDWKVMHIMKKNKADEHPYTKPARIIDGRLRYVDPEITDL